MNKIPLIIKHYMLRIVRKPLDTLLYLLIPLIIVAVNLMVAENVTDVPADAEQLKTMFVLTLAFTFQFFAGEMLLEWLYKDSHSDMKHRLHMAPVSRLSFTVAQSFMGIVFSFVIGLLIWLFGWLAFGVEIVNPLLVLGAMVINGFLTVFMVLIIYLLAKSYKVAKTTLYIICFSMMLLSGGLGVPLGDHAVVEFFTSFGTPISLGLRALDYARQVAVDYSEVWLSFGILLGIAFALNSIVIVLMMTRREKV